MNITTFNDSKHGIRVANMSVEIAKLIQLPQYKISELYYSGLFHDVGKVHLNQSVLNKPGKLTDKERKHIKNHSFYSYREVLKLGYSEKVAIDVLYHHENWNGTGYPKKLKDYSIPIGARILRLSDVFDALTTERPYRNKTSTHDAIYIMQQEKNNYDPDLFQIFVKYLLSPKVLQESVI